MDSECPEPSCSVAPDAVLQRAEQKLVDTMLTADLIHLSQQGDDIFVVSTDDDMWPGIRSALNTGCRVYHLHPRRGRSTRYPYRQPAPPNYFEFSL
jgi:uncharacterized LabA/DUF88 family protein